MARATSARTKTEQLMAGITRNRTWAAGVFMSLVTALAFGSMVSAQSAPAAVAANPSTPQAQQAEIVAGEVLIKLKSSTTTALAPTPTAGVTGVSSLDQLDRSVGAARFDKLLSKSSSAANSSPLAQWYKISLPGAGKSLSASQDPTAYAGLQKIVQQYASDPNVEYAEPSYVVHGALVPNDPLYSSARFFSGYDDQWGLKKINSAAAWDLTTGSTNTVIAVIDSGVDAGNPEIAANMWNNPDGSGTHGWNFVDNTSNTRDGHGHGTLVAGIIGAATNNGLSIAGLNWNTQIMAVKVVDDHNSGNTDQVTQGIQWAADNGARVANLSFDCGCISKAVEDSIQYAHDLGVVVVAAAGNSSLDARDNAPANVDGAITVGATDPYDNQASFSNFGPKIDVMAPGVNILSLTSKPDPMCNTNSYAYVCWESGTSASTPFVSGLAGLLLSQNPSLTPEAVRQIIRSGAVDLGSPGKDDTFGYGRIDAYNALAGNQSPLAPSFQNLHSRDKIMPGQANEVVTGTIPGPRFASCKLEASPDYTSPVTWISAKNTCWPHPNVAGAFGKFNSSTFNGNTYTVRLTAIDRNGQTYEYSVYHVQIGLSPGIPNVAITAPPAGATVSGTVYVKATITANPGERHITKGRLYVDGVLIATDTTAPYVFKWDTTRQINHPHNIIVRGYNDLGQAGVASELVTIAN